MKARLLLVLLVVASLAAVLTGCGGGGSQPAQVSPAAISPWAGTYYSWSHDASLLTFISTFRVSKLGILKVCGGGPALHGPWSGSGQVQQDGTVNFTVPGAQIQSVWGGGKSDLVFTGKFVNDGGVITVSGKYYWKKYGVANKMDWLARKTKPLANANTWNYRLGTTPATYDYANAFAVLGDWNGNKFLVMAFEGTKTTWPAESMIVMQNPQLTPLNQPGATFISALWLGETKDKWYRHTQVDAEQPKLTMTKRNLTKGGFVTGRVSGFLKRYDNAERLNFGVCPAVGLKIIDAVDLGT